ncbi:MAG: shikimate kinase [Salinivirgaceae bacterium]|jgi:shikimate kinase|nr:shikimate kinase [Salinivirgaceae bacterium]
MRIYLMGFMSSGKTTHGFQLAKALNLNFLDLDQYIEKKTKISVHELFQTRGEAYFRQLEREALDETFQMPHAVVSTGGGAPCFFDNVQAMNKNGITFYLKLPPKIILHRLQKSTRQRPLLANKTPEELAAYINQLLNERRTFYEQAHYTVDASNKNATHYITRILSGYMY